MEYVLNLADRAKKDLANFPKDVQKRIAKKIDYFLASPNPLHYAEQLTDITYGTHRFRVGNYRIRFDIEYKKDVVLLQVLTIRHRDEKTYKD